MIGLLTGTIVSTKRNPLILQTGGVGYLVHVPDTLITKLTGEKNAVLYIHTHVREDTLDLYGFLLEEDLLLFQQLLTVSGIGPKTALLVMNHGVGNIEQAIRNGDVDFFTTIPRLGKKNAQKIIIELKNKLGSLKDLDLTEDSDKDSNDIADALVNMGFRKNEIITIVKKLDLKEGSLEQKIRMTLKYLGKP